MTPYIASSASCGFAQRLRNLGGLWVSEAFCGRIHGRVNDVLPILEPGEDYDSADRCGCIFMARLTPSQRRQVDQCLTEIAARGALPLRVRPGDADGTVHQRLIGGAR